MPRVNSDEGSSDGAMLLSRRERNSAQRDRAHSEDELNNDADSVIDDGTNRGEIDDDGADEYVVEAIMSHIVDKGKIKFEVKWEGYDAETDRTWEAEDNLEGLDVLQEYLEKHGGREKILVDTKKAKSKKRGRLATVTSNAQSKRLKKEEDHPADAEPSKTERAAAWKPPAGSWENEVAEIDVCENDKTGTLMIFLHWKNGQKTQHEPDVVYRRCPFKMCKFYEKHVRIRKEDNAE